MPSGAELDRLIAAGRVLPPVRSGLPEPIALDGDPNALSRALDEIRHERWPLPLCYLDSSAIVKLVVDEPEGRALRSFIDRAVWRRANSS